MTRSSRRRRRRTRRTTSPSRAARRARAARRDVPRSRRQRSFDARRACWRPAMLPTILTFNYSDCPMLCSLQLNGLSAALPQIADKHEGAMRSALGEQFRIVTIDLEPNESIAKLMKMRDKYLARLARGAARAGARGLDVPRRGGAAAMARRSVASQMPSASSTRTSRTRRMGAPGGADLPQRERHRHSLRVRHRVRPRRDARLDLRRRARRAGDRGRLHEPLLPLRSGREQSLARRCARAAHRRRGLCRSAVVGLGVLHSSASAGARRLMSEKVKSVMTTTHPSSRRALTSRRSRRCARRRRSPHGPRCAEAQRRRRTRATAARPPTRAGDAGCRKRPPRRGAGDADGAQRAAAPATGTTGRGAAAAARPAAACSAHGALPRDERQGLVRRSSPTIRSTRSGTFWMPQVGQHRAADDSDLMFYAVLGAVASSSSSRIAGVRRLLRHQVPPPPRPQGRAERGAQRRAGDHVDGHPDDHLRVPVLLRLAQSYINVVTPPQKAVEINVLAWRWNWQFTH